MDYEKNAPQKKEHGHGHDTIEHNTHARDWCTKCVCWGALSGMQPSHARV